MADRAESLCIALAQYRSSSLIQPRQKKNLEFYSLLSSLERTRLIGGRIEDIGDGYEPD
jgi:hypothetical protein